MCTVVKLVSEPSGRYSPPLDLRSPSATVADECCAGHGGGGEKRESAHAPYYARHGRRGGFQSTSFFVM